MRLVRGNDDLTGTPGTRTQKVLEVLVNKQWMQAAVDLVDEIDGPARLHLIESGDQVQKTLCAIRLLGKRQCVLSMWGGFVGGQNINTIETLAFRGTLHQQLGPVR